MRSLLIVGIFLYTFFPLLPSCIDMRIKLLSYISFALVSESQNRLLDLYYTNFVAAEIKENYSILV